MRGILIYETFDELLEIFQLAPGMIGQDILYRIFEIFPTQKGKFFGVEVWLFSLLLWKQGINILKRNTIMVKKLRSILMDVAETNWDRIRILNKTLKERIKIFI